MEEIWDVYDRNRRKTGRTMVRGSAFLDGDLHLAVHVCLFNGQGEMLIQQASMGQLNLIDKSRVVFARKLSVFFMISGGTMI